MMYSDAMAPPSAPPPLYYLDATWSPQLPLGAHAFSAVALGRSSDAVYVAQRGNVSIDPILVLSSEDGTLLRTWGLDAISSGAIANSTVTGSGPGSSPATWGAHGLAAERVDGGGERLWVDDFFAHTLSAFDANGTRLLTVGTPGTAGDGTSPTVQFSSLADTATDGHGGVFVADGDGGGNNRVVKLRVPKRLSVDGANGADGVRLEWATPVAKSRFDNPHSLALHNESGLVIVADREHASLRLLRASDGTDLGAWTCGLEGGGKPFGVRAYAGHGASRRSGGARSDFWSSGVGGGVGGGDRAAQPYTNGFFDRYASDGDDALLSGSRSSRGVGGGSVTPSSSSSSSSLDLLFIAIYDNPPEGEAADGAHQRLVVVDAAPLSSWVRHAASLAWKGQGTSLDSLPPPECRVLQELPIDPKVYSGPHLLGVDARNGDVYAALVSDTPRSTVLRFRLTGGGGGSGWGGAGSDDGEGFAMLLAIAFFGLCLWTGCFRNLQAWLRARDPRQAAMRAADLSAAAAARAGSGGTQRCPGIEMQGMGGATSSTAAGYGGGGGGGGRLRAVGGGDGGGRTAPWTSEMGMEPAAEEVASSGGFRPDARL